LDYCVNDTVVFPLNDTDKQCAYNRSGLLCGACKKGYSLVLGTSQCWKCTNIYLLLLIAFAVMGVALVLFLFVCKLTVATGALSGLLFYANIVGVNRTIFLPVESTNLLCLGTGVPRHSAGGVATFVRTYVRAWYVSLAMRMRE